METFTDLSKAAAIMFPLAFIVNYAICYRPALYILKKWCRENGYELIESKFMNIRLTMGPYADMWISKAPTFKIRIKDSKTEEEKIGWFRAKYIFFVYSMDRTEIIWE